MQQFNILHILVTIGHHQKAKPTLQRKHYICMITTCCLKGISTITNQDKLNTNVIKVS
jgi:hypothetical protein